MDSRNSADNTAVSLIPALQLESQRLPAASRSLSRPTMAENLRVGTSCQGFVSPSSCAEMLESTNTWGASCYFPGFLCLFL